MNNQNLEGEFTYTASRSSGAGGQNVNKVNSKIELRFNISASKLLTLREKSILLHKLANRINDQGELVLVSQESRSQGQNKEIVIARFYQLLSKALQPVKRRKKTKPTKASKERRLAAKRSHSQTKALRNYKTE